MNTKWTKSGKRLRLSLTGELGHREAIAIMAEMPRMISQEPAPIFEINMSGVSFMDSSGIAVAIQGKKLSAAAGSGFYITDAPPQAMKVFTAAGIDRLVEFKRGSQNEKSDK